LQIAIKTHIYVPSNKIFVEFFIFMIVFVVVVSYIVSIHFMPYKSLIRLNENQIPY
jgi:hypothetical protein